MDKFVIHSGRPLKGHVVISGSKNAVLPIMAATLLADGAYEIDNVPDLRDVKTMSKMLLSLGQHSEYSQNRLRIVSGKCTSFQAPYDLVKTMRASVYVLGPLLARYGQACVSLPGGCAWGPRPVDLHIDGMRKLGAKIDIKEGYIHAHAKSLKGAQIAFDVSSVGATGNVMMAAVLADGQTVIENAAREPEIVALAHFLVKMGARIEGIGTDRIEIDGVDSLHPADASVIPDRIEAGTFLVAGHITGGTVTLHHADAGHLTALIQKLRDSGAKIETGNGTISVQSSGRVFPVDITTSVYPGFPTDMQAQWMALMCMARGSSVITDEIYLDRFMHVAELRRLGAHISLDHNVAVIKGSGQLSGAPVMSTDLRASASLILAGLVAKGRTDISRVYHIDRGYEGIERKLEALGANIHRELEELVT
ncbi:UDP-N-acetylglucosamine 1-carboxyvinyltransferase [bacterium]|nr:UDP-N-acetylglucosamine 1-carboxyvinyltransferase [bacterium]